MGAFPGRQTEFGRLIRVKCDLKLVAYIVALADPAAAIDPGDPAAAQRRIEELERKIGQQQLELDFFRAALRHVREQRLKEGGPGETPSTR